MSGGIACYSTLFNPVHNLVLLLLRKNIEKEGFLLKSYCLSFCYLKDNYRSNNKNKD